MGEYLLALSDQKVVLCVETSEGGSLVAVDAPPSHVRAALERLFNGLGQDRDPNQHEPEQKPGPDCGPRIHLIPIRWGPPIFRLAESKTKRVIALAAPTRPGAGLETAEEREDPSQLWRFEADGPDYRIVNPESGLVLAVDRPTKPGLHVRAVEPGTEGVEDRWTLLTTDGERIPLPSSDDELERATDD